MSFGSIIRRMKLRAFLEGTEEVEFEAAGEDSQRYAFVVEVVGGCATAGS